MIFDYIEYIERVHGSRETGKAVCQCQQCGDSLFLGDEVLQVEDVLIVNFCDIKCAYKYLEIEEVPSGSQGQCSLCGEDLKGDEFEVWKDYDGDLFCCPECAEIRSGLRLVELGADL